MFVQLPIIVFSLLFGYLVLLFVPDNSVKGDHEEEEEVPYNNKDQNFCKNDSDGSLSVKQQKIVKHLGPNIFEMSNWIMKSSGGKRLIVFSIPKNNSNYRIIWTLLKTLQAKFSNDPIMFVYWPLEKKTETRKILEETFKFQDIIPSIFAISNNGKKGSIFNRKIDLTYF